MRRGARRIFFLVCGALAVFIVVTTSRIRTASSLNDQGYFDKYPYLAQLLVAGELSADRLADASPLYLRLIAVANGRLDVGELINAQLAATSLAMVLCAAAAGWLGGPLAAVVTFLLLLGNRAVLVNATELEPETLILLLHSLVVFFLAAWQRTRQGAMLWLAGLALGLSVITRPSALLIVVILVMWLLGIRPGFSRIAAFLALSLLPPVLLIAWNVKEGRLAMVMDPGTVFYEGMNPLAGGYGGVQPRIVNDLERLTTERDALHLTYQFVASRASHGPISKAESNRYWKDKAVRFARTYPGRAAELIGRKSWLSVKSHEAWDLSTMARKDWELQSQFWIPFGVMLGLAIAALVLRVEGALPLGLMSAASAATMIIFYVTARQRNALLPSVAILAGLGVSGVFRAWRRGKKPDALVATLVGAAVAALSIADGKLQQEDRHAWLTAFSSQELTERANTLSDPREAATVRAHAATWLTSDWNAPCATVAPAAVAELKRSAAPARLFDLAVILTRCGEFAVSDEILETLSRQGYQPVRDTRAPSSIAYHRARNLVGLKDPARARATASQALEEAPGDPDILALRAALSEGTDQEFFLQRLRELHDPLTAELAWGQALRDAGLTRESLEVMKKLQKDLPQWKRANSPRAPRRS